MEEIIAEINDNGEIYSEEIKRIFTIMLDQILKIKIGEEKAEELKQNIEKEKRGEEKMMAVFETIEEDNKKIFNNGIKVGIETGIKSGIKTGIKTGMKSGAHKRNLEIIKNMLKEKLPVDLISKVTGVSQKEINKMK